MNDIWAAAHTSTPFKERHIGSSVSQQKDMLKLLGYTSLEQLCDRAVPDSIKDSSPADLPKPASQTAALEELKSIFEKNVIKRSLLGLGYYDTETPAPIQRCILENPSWYTQYTPYQAEIAQGRLEALLNFQTMICDLTGFEVSNASLLDEGTGAAEAMNMAFNLKSKSAQPLFLVDEQTHPQTIAVIKTRAKYLGIEVQVVAADRFDFSGNPFGVFIQYPGTDGSVANLESISSKAKNHEALTICATDLLALCLLEAPGQLGADIAVGSSQRFGVPLGFGGPHAGFIATKKVFERKLPGRIVGVSKDAHGNQALRLALATREQHIRRDKATSNICTSQVLLAIMASMYSVYHGPKGLTAIANRVHSLTSLLAAGLKEAGFGIHNSTYFDTLSIDSSKNTDNLFSKALAAGFNLLKIDQNTLRLSLDERSSPEEVVQLLKIFGSQKTLSDLNPSAVIPEQLKRKSSFLTHDIFNSFHSEPELTRYIKKLEKRDLSLTHSMIPLGSCTMKLNAAAELMPISWPKVSQIHPFVPEDQRLGYNEMFNNLEQWLSQITGFDAVSLQPNSGAQGEYAGLLVIRQYQEHIGQSHRDICLIPNSAHGTNPASAVLAGLKVVPLKCTDDGDIDIGDLKGKAAKHRDHLSSIMITYPSTHGVFEEGIKEICQIVHDCGGQVYMDGANLQAQIGLCKAGTFGPDVCHLNLHKTFCIPHGGGGPGVGPIAVKAHLADYLPGHVLVKTGGSHAVGAVSSAPWGSPSILPISWMYIRMMGHEGLAEATKVAILNANYIAKRLKSHFEVVYTGRDGLVAHECIIDLKPIKRATGIDEADIAKRLMDFGFHAPTMSWPVPASMMIEPTESESKNELDRFCDAMIQIKSEVDQVASGVWPRDDNPVKNAPHTAFELTKSEWSHPYERHIAAYPLPYVRDNKFWPHVGRIDNAFGDRNLVCSCPSMDQYQ